MPALQYNRAAYPASIDYGMRADELTKPSATVTFGVKQRCLKSDSACDAANFAKTDDPGAYRPWWDTPGNLNCKSTSKLCPPFPSFWTQLRLDTVTTKAARAGQTGLGKVDVYALHQSFPEDWYDTSPGLWLDSITRTGYGPGDTTGTVQSKDGISFARYSVGSTSPLHAWLKDRQLPNLVSKGKNDQNPGFTRPRIGTVSTEYGGDIEVEYTGGCQVEPADDKGKDNGTCYPVRWSPDGDERTPAKAWFNKYVVDSVTETDKVTSHGKPIVTKYKYSGAAWARSDDEFTRPALRTYSDWRGYRQVAVVKGSKSVSEQGDPQSQSYSVTRYFQGTGGEVKDSTSTHTLLADDAPQYAGMTAETITYRDSDGQLINQTLNYPWSKQTASRPRENEDGTDADPLLAHRAGVKRTDAIQTLSSDGSWRAVRTLTTVDDDYGLPIQVETAVVEPSGSSEKLSDQTCTVTSYVHNTTAWLIGLPKEQRVTGTSCADYPSADPATQLKSATRNTYDGLTYGATPTKGQITTVAEINGAGTAYATASDMTYDELGRVRTITKPGAGTTRTDYTPEKGGPVTDTKVIDALGHATTTTFDPGRSLPLTVTDPNGRVTRSEYDALGRLVKGWSASRSSGGKSPNVLIDYAPAVATSNENRPAAVTVQTLKDDGSYATGITLYDGLTREVQRQTEAHGPGRVITDFSYNDHGLPDEQTGAYLAKGDPDTTLFAPRSKSLIPTWTKHRYDGLEREVSASVYQGAEYKYATVTSYGFTSTYTDPPGATAPRTRTYYDALGRVSSIKHYSKVPSSSTAARSTTYAYDARGNRSTVTDPADNVWSYTYDARGLLTSATDPDTGTSHTWYDAADRPSHTQNARKQDAYTEYDLLGRVKNVRQGSTTATPSVEYTYDDAPGGIGQPGSAKRHTDSGDYTSSVTGYDADYHPTGTQTVIPSNSMTTGLAGTYAYSYTYTPTGKQQSVTLPAVGGLAKEKVVTRYDDDGLPESTSGLTWYTADATYSPYGEPLRTVSGAQPYRLWTTNFVDPHTGRLQRTVTDRETSGPYRISDAYYSYDSSGTITSSARKLSESTGDTWDNQCFTYDVMGELVHAWTSKTVPDGSGTGCTSADGTRWGYRTDYAPSSGPVTDVPDAASDTTSPDSSLATTLAAAAPDTTTTSTDATAYRQSFTFDWLGNRATMTDYNSAVSYTYGYGKAAAGGTTTQPHTMTGISSSPSGKGSAYTYDDSGNTTVRNLATTTQDLVWSPDNKLDSITADGKKTTYVYDASGNRLLENSPSGSTLYLGETELTTDATGLIVRASRSYAQAGAPTVVRTATNGATTGHKLAVLIADQLGTANTSVDLASGQPVTRRAYKPYGETRGTRPTNWPNKRSYLGVGIDDAATGLTHIGAREYDQNSGHFLSADPVIDITDPLQMNGYAYSGNSPVSHSDPSGLCRRDICGDGLPVAGDPKRNGYTGQRKGEKPCSFCNGPKTSYHYDPAEVFPGVRVSTSWKGRREFIQIFSRYVTEYANGAILPDFLTDGVTNPEAASEQLGWWGLSTCYEMRSCPGSLMNQFRSMSMGFGVSISAIAGSPFHPGAEAPPNAERAKTSTSAGNCFLAGTGVLLADGTTKNIEDVKLGDKVLSTNPTTGKTVAAKVTRLIRTEGEKYLNELHIATKDGIESLTTTQGHPFWSPSEHNWVLAGQLKPGMTLRTDKGVTVIVTANRPYTTRARTYNLTIENLHTYYVLAGATPVLVHNSGLCGVTVSDGALDHAWGQHGFGGAYHEAGDMGNVFSQDISKSQFRDMVDTTIKDGTKVPRSTSDLREGHYIDHDFGDVEVGHNGQNGMRVVVDGSGNFITAMPRFMY